MKSKLAFIGPLPPPLGGVSVMNQNVQQLLSSNYEIETFNTSGQSQREDLYGAKGFKEIRRLLTTWIACYQFLSGSHAQLVNIFVTSNIAFLRDAVFILMAKMHNKKVLVHLHSKKKGELFLGSWSIRFLAGVLNRTECVFVLSNDHKDFFSKYIEVDILEVLENFAFVEDLRPQKTRKSFEMMYIGRLTEQKGFYDLLLAVEALSKEGYKFLINVAGTAATDREDREIRELVEHKGLESFLVFHGLVSGHKKYEIFHKSIIMLFPSRFENSPVVLKEAMAAKQFILCSDIPANRNVLSGETTIDDGVLEFAVAASEDLAMKMKFLVDNQNIVYEVASGVNLRKEASDRFAREKLISVISRFTD